MQNSSLGLDWTAVLVTVRQFRRRVTAYLALQNLLWWMLVWGLSCGTLVLLARTFLGTPRFLLGWSAGLSAVVAALLAVGLALRRRPTLRQAVASLDRHNGCGGMLMAAEEVGLGAWKLPALQMPALRLQDGRPWLLAGLATAFTLACVALPQRLLVPKPPATLAIEPEIQRLADQIEALQELEILDPERTEPMQEALEQLQKEASGDDPARTLEALDHLENLVAQAAQQAAESEEAAAQKMEQATALAEALSENTAGLDPEFLAEAMLELGKMTQSAEEERQGTTARPGKNLPKTSPEVQKMLRELGQTLRKQHGDRMRRLQDLRILGVLDAKKLKSRKRDRFLIQPPSQQLEAYLLKNAEELDASELVELWMQGALPGSGGKSEGGGPAPLTAKDPTSEDGATFRDEALPDADAGTWQDSQLMGMTSSAPTVEIQADTPASGALQGVEAGSGSAVTHPLLPRHRSTVQRYFQRP